MRLFTYDFEVFLKDWLGVFKDYENKEYTVIHNDGSSLTEFLNQNADAVFCGFNSKHYDQFIVKAIGNGASIEEVKALNDFIIGGGQGWEHPLIRGNYFQFNNIDMKDDMQMGLSLKAIEGHLGMSVEESTVDFNLDRALTQEELDMTVFYCKHDVDTTERLFELRSGYLKSKMQVGRMCGLSDEKALSMTNAKLTAALLHATPRTYEDERAYQYPENLLKAYVPQEVFDFFDRMKNHEIPDEELFKSKLEISIGECPVTIGFGGIHAAIPHLSWEEKENPGRVIRNYDVSSYYPSLMIQNGYVSRSIPSAQQFEEIYHKRIAAKKSGDKATANAFKLVLNTTYGATLNQYNDLYDPLMARSVCISGQLYLLELAEHLFQTCEGLRIIQLNTDGIMIEFAQDQYPAVKELIDEWQERTHFGLEEDSIERIYQKDVNNYVEIGPRESVKSKGGYLVRGIAPAGAFNINNNATIVCKAIMEYFVHGTPVEQTINECSDISAFQLIAKAGAKYREAYHIVDGEKRPVQRVNRVYATTDERYGKLFKVKAETDASAKIEMLPEHCVIDNTAIGSPNHLPLDRVDRQFYIALAKKRIDDFLGIKPEKKGRTKKMATEKRNVYQKLAAVREKFLAAGAKKTGRNVDLSYKYFELDDIVPVAQPLFMAEGLLPLVSFTSETATMTIVNMEKPDENILFQSPMKEWAGNRAVNPLQALGASETYQRRYLYMTALDICEPDQIDNSQSLQKGEEAPAPAKKPPATPQQRENVKKELTAADGNATELQLQQLTKALGKLRKARPDKEEWLLQLATRTKGFTEISKTDCEALMKKVGEMLKETEGAA